MVVMKRLKSNLHKNLDMFLHSSLKEKNKKLAQELANLRIQCADLKTEKLQMQEQICTLRIENNMLKQQTDKAKDLVNNILGHTLIISSDITSFYSKEPHSPLITNDHNSYVRIRKFPDLKHTEIADKPQCFHSSEPENEFDDNSSVHNLSSNVNANTSPQYLTLSVIEEQESYMFNVDHSCSIPNNVKSCNSELSCTSNEVNTTTSQENCILPTEKLHMSNDIVNTTNKSNIFDIDQNQTTNRKTKKQKLRLSNLELPRTHSQSENGTLANTSHKSKQKIEVEQICSESPNCTNYAFSNKYLDQQEKENVTTCVQQVKDCVMIIEKIKTDQTTENMCTNDTEQYSVKHESPQLQKRFPRRCAAKVLNFKEPNLVNKMRRE